MTRKTRTFHDVRLERLADPEVAAQYLDATMQNAPGHFVEALRNVAEARRISGGGPFGSLVEESESPTIDTTSRLLEQLGLRLTVTVGVPVLLDSSLTLRPASSEN